MDFNAVLDRLAHDPAMTCDVAELALELARDQLLLFGLNLFCQVRWAARRSPSRR